MWLGLHQSCPHCSSTVGIAYRFALQGMGDVITCLKSPQIKGRNHVCLFLHQCLPPVTWAIQIPVSLMFEGRLHSQLPCSSLQQSLNSSSLSLYCWFSSIYVILTSSSQCGVWPHPVFQFHSFLFLVQFFIMWGCGPLVVNWTFPRSSLWSKTGKGTLGTSLDDMQTRCLGVGTYNFIIK